MISWVYILHSSKLNKYYIGFTTESPEGRLEKHLNKFYEEPKTFTKKADDWILVWCLKCSTIEQGRAIERHIKNMKSSKYIQNLIGFPEMGQKLLGIY
jgi:putative endonuclease